MRHIDPTSAVCQACIPVGFNWLSLAGWLHCMVAATSSWVHASEAIGIYFRTCQIALCLRDGPTRCALCAVEARAAQLRSCACPCMSSPVTVPVSAQAEELQAAPGVPKGVHLEVLANYCFLCERPRRLLLPQPIRGQRQIWRLPAATAAQFAPALKTPPRVTYPTFCLLRFFSGFFSSFSGSV